MSTLIKAAHKKRSRCGECDSCVHVDAAYLLPKKRREKERKKRHISHPCANVGVDSSKSKISEAEKLTSSEVRNKFVRMDGVSQASITERAAKPCNTSFKEGVYDIQLFTKFSSLVNDCQSVSAKTQDIAKESPALLQKMADYLDPTVRHEIDYDQATNDCTVVFLRWCKGETIGFGALSMPLPERDAILDALGFYTDTLTEFKKIEEEWITEFGEDGCDVFNDVLSRVTPEVQKDLPLVNSFLRAFLERIRNEDADLSFYTMEEWLHEATSENNANTSGATLMYKYFGCDPPDEDEVGDYDSKFLSSRVNTDDQAQPTSSLRIVRKPDQATRSRPRLRSAPSINKTVLRLSRLQKLGEELRKGFARAARNRIQNKKHAEECIKELLENEDFDTPLTLKEQCQSGRAARMMEEILFSQGKAPRVLRTLRSFFDRPAIREANLVRQEASPFATKEEHLSAAMKTSLRSFFRLFSKSKGPKTVEDKNVLDAALSALAHAEISDKRLGNALIRAIGVTRKHLSRASTLRASLEDMDKAHWIRAPPRQYASSIGCGKYLIIFYFSVVSF